LAFVRDIFHRGMTEQAHFVLHGEVIPFDCIEGACLRWGDDASARLRRFANGGPPFGHDVRQHLAHGRASIIEFIRVTKDGSADIKPEFVVDVMTLAEELDSKSITERGKRLLAGRYPQLPDDLRLEAERRRSTKRIEEESRRHSIPEFVAMAQGWELDLPVLNRIVPAVNDSTGSTRLFNFFLECLTHYGRNASVLFLLLPANRFTDDHFDRLETAGFNWILAHDAFIPILLKRRRELLADLDTANSHSRNQEKKLQEKDRLIAELQTRLKDQERRVGELENEVRSRDSKIQAFTQLVPHPITEKNKEQKGAYFKQLLMENLAPMADVSAEVGLRRVCDQIQSEMPGTLVTIALGNNLCVATGSSKVKSLEKSVCIVHWRFALCGRRYVYLSLQSLPNWGTT
jgi:hypothetical protein